MECPKSTTSICSLEERKKRMHARTHIHTNLYPVEKSQQIKEEKKNIGYLFSETKTIQDNTIQYNVK